MTDQIGAAKPPAFYLGDIESHLRQIVDYVAAAGDRSNATTPKDGSELTQMLRLDSLDVSITGNTNDLDLAGYSIIRANPSAGWNLTGIVAETGRLVIVANVSVASTLNLPAEDGGSVAANRFLTAILLQPNFSVVLWYDPTSTRWRKIAA